MLHVPVALLAYNRVELAQRVFQAIRQAQPDVLLVAADGPKDREDAVRCAAVRDLLAQVDWPCTVHTRFAPENLGVALGVSSGLDWVFSQVDRAIVLEDDTLPEPWFFAFCSELLDRYADDDAVMQISGTNLAHTIDSPYSYGFSKYTLPPWGWASWARAWEKYDFRIGLWPVRKERVRDRLGAEFPFWERLLNRYSQRLPSWDIQWNAALWLHEGYTIVPASNGVSNIGFDTTATFTKMTRSEFQSIPVTRSFQLPLRHPPAGGWMDREADYDPVIEPRVKVFMDEIMQFQRAAEVAAEAAAAAQSAAL